MVVGYLVYQFAHWLTNRLSSVNELLLEKQLCRTRPS